MPEPHVAGLLLGAALHVVVPWPLPGAGPAAVAAGALLVVAGLAMAAWATLAVGDQAVDDPSALATGGPFRYSRNPMYVGWTLLYLGVALATGAAWPLLVLPAVAVATHRQVRREERRLEARFGDAYRAYRRRTRRYL